MRSPAQKHLSSSRTVEAYVDVQDRICADLVDVIRQKRDASDAIDDTCKELNKWALECKPRINPPLCTIKKKTQK